LYDSIGIHYDTTRRADPEIARRLIQHLQIFDDRPVIDIACGTGNYTIMLKQSGLHMSGTDISETMLQAARKKSAEVDWVQADVTQLPFEDESYAGAICLLAVHHFQDTARSFQEIHRVLKPGSRFVIFTSSPEQMRKYWLTAYFPSMMEKSIQQMPDQRVIMNHLEKAGFNVIGTESFMIQPNLQDFFLYSGKYRPEMYLRDEVRQSISSFANLAEQEEIEEGCRKLSTDIMKRQFIERTRAYTSDLGDYLFITAEA
ncbi:MAG: methyltransferase type 11, partial [Paenibacillus sp. RIFOXYA1_FULL_44_5]